MQRRGSVWAPLALEGRWEQEVLVATISASAAGTEEHLVQVPRKVATQTAPLSPGRLGSEVHGAQRTSGL